MRAPLSTDVPVLLLNQPNMAFITSKAKLFDNLNQGGRPAPFATSYMVGQ